MNSILRVVWENSYIYEHPGTVNLYWYAQVAYQNIGSQPLPVTCPGATDPSLAKEHIRGDQGIPPNGDGYVAAEETFCSRNPNFTDILAPGGTFYYWAIFHNVPSQGELSLELSHDPPTRSAWVNPWNTPFDAPPPAVCPPELVALGLCQPTGSGQPPEITLLGADSLQHTAGCPFIGAGATAADAEDGDLTNSIIITGTENLNNPGLQILTYSVTDSSGLSDVKTRQVVVFGVVGTPGCSFVGTPAGKAPYLVVLVHGCCTDANDVINDWDSFGLLIAGTIQTPEQWEIMVWDWSADTPKIIGVNCLPDVFSCAYQHAIGRGLDLSRAIEDYPTYKYIHFIAHSAGANLINWAAKSLAGYKIQGNEERPFIHLTFLDAYTPNVEDREGHASYGSLPDYPEHYAEHYVDRPQDPFCSAIDFFGSTNATLPHAFNFDITDWLGTSEEKKECGHQWPRHWYMKSVTATEPGFEFLKYGHPLSREGGNDQFINAMGQLYPPPSSNPSDPSTGLLTLIYPRSEGVPIVTEVVFPSSILADGTPVIGTVKFTDSNGGVVWAQFDVLGDTCGGCFLPFGGDPGVSNIPAGEGEFNFFLLCAGEFFFTMKLALRDKDDNVSNPYTFSAECIPSPIANSFRVAVEAEEDSGMGGF